MKELHSRLKALGTAVPEILLPREGTDFSKWAVIACDQYTQDRKYWEQVKDNAGEAPSCLNLIFPEVFLEDVTGETRKQKVQEIRRCMDSYIEKGVFDAPRHCCVYVERSTPQHPKRRGLVLALDLERYNWAPEARPLIRATEGTLPERLPPRMEIRRGAPLELPHVLVLIDDEGDRLIPSLGALAQKRPPLYNTPLMMNSGAISGWALDTEEAWTLLAEGLESLAKNAPGRYGTPGDESPFLYAVGDGNHSLATAKAVWDEYKKAHAGDADLENHPARWALVEVENIYDSGIDFEPIHRVLFGADPQELFTALSSLKNIKCHPENLKKTIVRLESLSPEIATVGLEPLLDEFVEKKGCTVDFIHGEDEIVRLAADRSRQAVGIILPPVKKDGLFKTVAHTGPLPRKSFSMGESWEKRFYLEGRKLF